MPTIEIYEGPAAAKKLPSEFAHEQFEARLQWLQSKGVKVQRNILPGDDSRDFVNATVKSAFEAQGPECLPMVTVDEKIISVGGYPTPTELLQSVGNTAESDAEFIGVIAAEASALGAALAANDFHGFQRRWEHLRSLGVGDGIVANVVQAATVSAGAALRDDMRTRVEQLLAFGPQGKPPKPPCACGNA